MNFINGVFLPAVLGFLLDLCFGDPVWLYHPVRLMGVLITKTEQGIRKCLPKGPAWERTGGGILVLVVLSVTAIVSVLLLKCAYSLHPAAGAALNTFWCYQVLAVKSLKTESQKVYIALKNEGLPAARRAVAMIVGRDTEVLDENGVIKAAVETVAENTSDGVIAPLFYMAAGGAPLGLLYKAVNTMDSMIGYKNERYRYFGTVAAKLDDAANFIPARLCAWLMLAAACFLGMDWKNGFQIYRRDRRNHKSPNAAQTEAVMAGVLNVQLAGNAWYFGTLYEKPTIGNDLRPVEAEDIRRAHKLLYGTAVLGLVFLLAVSIAFWSTLIFYQ